jgi:adenosylhomocysteine nucleosidase
MRAVLLAPLMPEARAFARAFHFPRTSCRFPHRLAQNGHLTIALIGPGAAHLQEVRALNPPLLILAGLAGALAPDLKIGDVIIDGNFSPPAPIAGARRGKIATAAHIIATPADKAALFRQTGALAVDMETETCREFAAALGVPFLAVRAISDTADQALDPALLNLLDENGRPRLGRVLRHIAGDPRRVAALIRLGRATELALSRLSTVLVAIVESGWPENCAKES